MNREFPRDNMNNMYIKSSLQITKFSIEINQLCLFVCLLTKLVNNIVNKQLGNTVCVSKVPIDCLVLYK